MKIKVTGEIREQDLATILKFINDNAYSADLSCVLLDFTDSHNQISQFATLQFIDNYPDNFKSLRISVLVSPDRMPDSRLYESILYSSGYPTRFFTDLKKAEDFLKG